MQRAQQQQQQQQQQHRPRRRGGPALLPAALFLLVVGGASAFLTPAVTPTAAAAASSTCSKRQNAIPTVVRAAADGEDSNGNNIKGLPGGLDLAKIFTPPSTTAPFGGLGQQVASFFERLLNPVGGNGGKQEQAAAGKQGAGQKKPKRRTGGPVSVVFGATGRSGREIVGALLAAGHDVVAAVRNETKLGDVFGAAMLESPSPAAPGQGLLDWVGGVDVTDAGTLMGPALFAEADHVILALGPVGGPQPGGGFGFLPGLTSEDVDFKGVVNVVEAFRAQSRKLQQQEAAEDRVLFSFRGPEGADAAKFERLDDVIMGGRSSSRLQVVTDDEGECTCIEYTGNLVVEDGGFCGHRASGLQMDLTGFDGLRLRVKGDGNRYKLNLKTTDAAYQAPECVYQVAFDTLPGQWTTVELPFERFFPVIRNRLNYKLPGLAGVKRERVATSFGIVYSRFEFNRAPNPYYQPGAFSLKIADITAYKAPRPAVVLVSSAGAERNAKVETEAERRAEIPIVQLNPGGILNWKYKAETHLRTAGVPYTVLRACGLVPDKATNGTTRRLQAGQGDAITGTLTRADLAQAVVGALNSPFSAYKTVEVRRDEASDAVGKPTDFDALFKPLVRDLDRAVSGLLLPFPEAVDPPGDVTPERRQEILADPRVQATVQRDRQLSSARAGASPAVAGASAAAASE